MEVLQKKQPCGGCTISVEDLQVCDKEQVILEDVSFHLHCGEFLAVIGPNGGGKTTLVKAMLGLRDHGGTVRFAPKDGAARTQIGYVPQVLEFDRLSPMTVADLLGSALSKRPVFLGLSRTMRAQAAAMLTEVKAERLLHRPLGQLSGGELQRVLLALSLVPAPQLLLLDEPISGMDVNGLELFYSVLRDVRARYDLSVLMVSHDLRLVERYADKAALIDRRLLAFGTPKAVFGSQAFFDTFGYGEGVRP